MRIVEIEAGMRVYCRPVKTLGFRAGFARVTKVNEGTVNVRKLKSNLMETRLPRELQMA